MGWVKEDLAVVAAAREEGGRRGEAIGVPASDKVDDDARARLALLIRIDGMGTKEGQSDKVDLCYQEDQWSRIRSVNWPNGSRRDKEVGTAGMLSSKSNWILIDTMTIAITPS